MNTTAAPRGRFHALLPNELLSGADGFRPAVIVLLTLVAAVLTVLRGATFLLRANFYAEDGVVWFHDAYTFGWLHALALPNVGYLSTAERLGAALSLFAPLHLAPVVLVLFGLLCQLSPLPYLLSARARDLGTLRLRTVMALLYVFMPNSHEVFLVDTNCMWHLAITMALIVVIRPPQRAVWRVVDALIVVAAALSGPYSIVLAPLAWVFWAVWRRRELYTAWLALLLTAGAALQEWIVVHAATRPHHVLGVDLQTVGQLLGGQFAMGTYGSNRHWGVGTPLPVLLVAFVLAALMYAVCVAEAPAPWKLLIVYGLLVLAGSLRSPLQLEAGASWPLMISSGGGERYWYIPGQILLWSTLWVAARARLAAVRYVAVGLMACTVLGAARDIHEGRMVNAQFLTQARRFEQLPSGSVMRFQIWPPNWTMELRKH